MLPISVLVPTRNSMSLLPQHLEYMRPWRDLVQEVVAVDSHSTDGTLELLQQEFRSSARVLSHPPGLYQSWNFGIAQCTAEYLYISTVGDCISRIGIEKLYSAAKRFGADIAVSPPAMIDTQGRPVEKVWPIHKLVDELELRAPVMLDGAAAQLFAITNLRRGILGSSASNLYRTEILQKHPFRTDFGTAGDLAWGLEHAGKVNLAVVPEKESTFVFHPKSYAKSDYAVDDFAGRCFALARSSVSAGREETEVLLQAWDRFLAARNAVAASKKSPFWFLLPSAWRAHAERSAAERSLALIQRDAMQSLRTQIASGNSALPR